jgi:hypothetical protein
MNTPITSTFRGNRHIISKTVTTNYTIADNIEAVNVDATGGPITITLPLISLNVGRLITVRKIDASANAVTVARAGSDLYQGETSVTLTTQWAVLSIDNDGSQWYSNN